eukprot:gene7178-7984_t
MIRTIIWFASGGLFTACYSNAIRRFPLFKKPSRHLLFTAIGLGLGLYMHRVEENSEEIFKELISKHKNAPWYPEGVLLAERATRLQALKAEGVEVDAELEIEDEFEDDEEDDSDE